MDKRSVVWMERFLHAWKYERDRSPKTLRAYRSDLRDFLAWLGSTPVTKANKEQVRAYLASLSERGLKEATIRRRLAALKVFYRFLEDENKVRASPAASLRRPTSGRKRLPRVMPLPHIDAVLRAAHERGCDGRGSARQRALRLRDQLCVELLFATGIRSHELVGLNVDDLDLDQGGACIRGKGGRERVVPICHPEVLECLRAYQGLRDALEPRSPALVLNRYGDRLAVQSVRTIFRRLLRCAGVEGSYTPHYLRHSMATYLIENGADVRSAQDLLGHASIQTTQIYLDVSRKRRVDVMARYGPRNGVVVARG